MQRKLKYIVINTVEPILRIGKTCKIKFETILAATVAKIMILLLGDPEKVIFLTRVCTIKKIIGS